MNPLDLPDREQTDGASHHASGGENPRIGIYLPYFKWLKSVRHMNDLELFDFIMRVMMPLDQSQPQGRQD